MGHAIRPSKRVGISNDVTHHLHSAMHTLEECSDDTRRYPNLERDCKRRKIAYLAQCIPASTRLSHSSAQTDSKIFDDQGLKRVMEETGDEIKATILRHNQHHEAALEERDDLISSLQDRILLIQPRADQRCQIRPGGSIHASFNQDVGLDCDLQNDGQSNSGRSCVSELGGDFSTASDIRALSRACWFHWVRFGPANMLEDMVEARLMDES